MNSTSHHSLLPPSFSRLLFSLPPALTPHKSMLKSASNSFSFFLQVERHRTVPLQSPLPSTPASVYTLLPWSLATPTCCPPSCFCSTKFSISSVSWAWIPPSSHFKVQGLSAISSERPCLNTTPLHYSLLPIILTYCKFYLVRLCYNSRIQNNALD